MANGVFGGASVAGFCADAAGAAAEASGAGGRAAGAGVGAGAAAGGGDPQLVKRVARAKPTRRMRERQPYGAFRPAAKSWPTIPRVDRSDVYLMSPPGESWSLRGRANFRSEQAAAVSPRRARKEWLALAEAIEAAGATVVVLPPVDEALTGMPYAAEAGHVLAARRPGGKPRFLLPRMAAPHRARERDHWGPLAEKLGFEVIDPGAGVWEGQGDVATFDGTTLLFFGGRTDRAGLTAALAHFDGEVQVIELRQPAFHGNMALLPLPHADKILVCQDVIVGDGLDRLAERFGGWRLDPVSESEIRSYATNGLPIGDRWLAPSVVPQRVKDRVAALGMKVIELAMGELCEKAGGASRCLVCHAPGVRDALTIPEENRLEQTRAKILSEPDDG